MRDGECMSRQEFLEDMKSEETERQSETRLVGDWLSYYEMGRGDLLQRAQAREFCVDRRSMRDGDRRVVFVRR